MKWPTKRGKSTHYRYMAHHRASKLTWRESLLPEFKDSFYRENENPDEQLYQTAKQLPNPITDCVSAVGDARREVLIRVNLADSFRYIMFVKTWVYRRFKNVHVQLCQSDEGGILILWNGPAKEKVRKGFRI